MRKSFFKGDLEKYNQFILESKDSGESFVTMTVGLSRKVKFQNGLQYKYFGTQKNKQFIDGAFLTPMVIKEVDKYIEQNGIPDKLDKVDVQQFNFEKIINEVRSDKKRPILGIDINSCYWRTANLLGYISDDLYERGLSTAKKKGLLVAIGCLNKLPIYKEFKGGECVNKWYGFDYHNKYSPFYWQIINHTHELMMECYDLMKENFYMFLTDCVFVDMKAMNVAQKFFIDRGYNIKHHVINFEKYDGKRLIWWDNKDQRLKGIYASSRDINNGYDAWKISKGASFDTPLPKLHIAPKQNNELYESYED
jgi:hypothetical protein